MRCKWARKHLSLCCSGTGEESRTLYAFPLGPLEIVLIVTAIILVFGVGKLSQVGGALGKSIREFRKEKGGSSDVPRLTTRDTAAEKNAGEVGAKSKDESSLLEARSK